MTSPSPTNLHFWRNALHAGGPLPSPPNPFQWKKGGWLVARVREALVGQAISLSNDISSTVASRFQHSWGKSGLATQWNAALFSRTQWKKHFRTVVEHVRPPADDRRRGDVTSPLERGKQVWSTGDTFFLMLKMEQFEKRWHYDSEGRRVHTKIRKRNPIMDSIRRCGLHPPPEEMVAMTSFRDTVMALSGNQAAEAQLYQADNIWAYPGTTTTAPQYLGGASLDLEEMWKYGMSRSPDWDPGDEGNGDTEESTEEMERGEYDMWNVRHRMN